MLPGAGPNKEVGGVFVDKWRPWWRRVEKTVDFILVCASLLINPRAVMNSLSEKCMNDVYKRLWTNNESPTSQLENILLLSGLQNDNPVIVRSEYLTIWD
jgi:hypothetical protein